MDPKEAHEPLCVRVFTASERDGLRRLRKDYQEQMKHQKSVNSNRLLFARWLVQTGRLTDQLV